MTWKDLIYILLIIGSVLTTRSCVKHSSTGSSVKPPVLVPVVYKIDKKGTDVTVITGTLYTESDMKRITDSIRKVSGSGKVHNVINTVTVIDTQFYPKLVYVDTISGDVRSSDSSLYHHISFDGNYRTHTGNFHLRLTPDTAAYITSVKHHFFKPDQVTTTIYHSNKLLVPISGNTYSYKPSRTVAVIGPFVGCVYDGRFSPAVGIGITLNLIPIRLK